MEIKIVNKSNHPLPHYGTEASAGVDLRANITESITLKPLERTLVKTGLFINVTLWTGLGSCFPIFGSRPGVAECLWWCRPRGWVLGLGWEARPMTIPVGSLPPLGIRPDQTCGHKHYISIYTYMCTSIYILVQMYHKPVVVCTDLYTHNYVYINVFMLTINKCVYISIYITQGTHI